MDNQYFLTYACIHFALAIKLVISFDSDRIPYFKRVYNVCPIYDICQFCVP